VRVAGSGRKSGLARALATAACTTSGGVRTFKAVANAVRIAADGNGDIV
jgi:hypothetical protein